MMAGMVRVVHHDGGDDRNEILVETDVRSSWLAGYVRDIAGFLNSQTYYRVDIAPVPMSSIPCRTRLS
jgi:hypothetical protein